MSKYVVVKTYSFDPETDGVEFTDHRKATAYLHWWWEQCYNMEIAEGSDINELSCYHESEYARIQWLDGDYTEFYLIEILPPFDDFPADWERYVCE
jgi:hypothetical protein